MRFRMRRTLCPIGVSDGFWMSRGLDDPKLDAEARAAVFFERLDYEDNAQYYLIWSAIVWRSD